MMKLQKIMRLIFQKHLWRKNLPGWGVRKYYEKKWIIISEFQRDTSYYRRIPKQHLTPEKKLKSFAFWDDSISIDMCLFISPQKCLDVSVRKTPSKLAKVLYREFEYAYNYLKSKYNVELEMSFKRTISHTPLKKDDNENICFDDYAHCDISLHIPDGVSGNKKAKIRKEFSKKIMNIISENNPQLNSIN